MKSPERGQSLSDLLIQHPERLRATRALIEAWTRSCRAQAAFLVDESGQPFASVGQVDFVMPRELKTFINEDAKDAVLAALVGQRLDTSGCDVQAVCDRALLVTLGAQSGRDARHNAFRRTRASLRKTWEPLTDNTS